MHLLKELSKEMKAFLSLWYTPPDTVYKHCNYGLIHSNVGDTWYQRCRPISHFSFERTLYNQYMHCKKEMYAMLNSIPLAEYLFNGNNTNEFYLQSKNLVR